jgi:alpha-aminoadipate carrier protein LysW
MASCPECDAEIEVDEFDVDKGDQLSCPECGSNLEVVGLSPLKLDFAPDDEEEEDEEEDEEAGDLDDEFGEGDEEEEEAEDDEGWDE